MFKNLTVFKLHEAAHGDAKRLMDDALLAEHALRQCGPLEIQTAGFAPLLEVEDPPYSLTVNDCVMVSVARQYREVPAGPLKEELKKRIKAWEADHQSVAGSRVRRELKAAVSDAMLAKAFTQTAYTRGYIDLKHGWVVIDSASTKAVELFLVVVRKALGSFAVTPLCSLAQVAAAGVMTRWLATGDLPDAFALGNACELKGANQETARFSHANLECKEIRDLLGRGMLATKVDVQAGDAVATTITQDLVFKKFELLGGIETSSEEDGTPLSNLAANLTLLSGTVRAFLQDVVRVFEVMDEPAAEQPAKDERQLALTLGTNRDSKVATRESSQDTNVIPMHPTLLSKLLEDRAPPSAA